MSVHKNYPDGCAPSSGPFDVFISSGGPYKACQFIVGVDRKFVGIDDPAVDYRYAILPTEARELAAALIECADFIDRANMTPEQIAAETAKRC